MGYIFDAINRADRDAPKPASTPQAPADPFVVAHDSASTTAAPPHDVATPDADTNDATLEPLIFCADPVEGEQHSHLDDRLVPVTAPDSAMAEEYRAIRTTLLARCSHRRHLVHTITSATPQEGKTITSLNLGLSFGELRNRSTVVVEADLRLPTFDKLLGIAEAGTPGADPGLVDYLRNQASLNDVVRRVEGSRLCAIPAGQRCGAEAIQLLSSQRMADLLTTLRTKFDHVIVDTPPVTELADAGILGALSDEVMLVVRMGRTPRPLVEQAVRTLRGYHAPVAGVIATDQQRTAGRYYYRYGYRYGYQHRRAA